VRVTNVEAIPLLVRLPAETKAPISIPHADRIGKTVFKGYRACLVRVHTDEGPIGIGECMVRLAPEATAAIVIELGEVLEGVDPFDTMVAWELMFSVMMNRGHLKGFFMEALSDLSASWWCATEGHLGIRLLASFSGDRYDNRRSENLRCARLQCYETKSWR
jgi:L-alanine-DL-glutamate epimerase-like enolase superfamily enzyme